MAASVVAAIAFQSVTAVAWLVAGAASPTTARAATTALTRPRHTRVLRRWSTRAARKPTAAGSARARSTVRRVHRVICILLRLLTDASVILTISHDAALSQSDAAN